jgi:hypothetical protein
LGGKEARNFLAYEECLRAVVFLGSNIHTSYSDCMDMDIDEFLFLVKEVRRMIDG